MSELSAVTTPESDSGMNHITNNNEVLLKFLTAQERAYGLSPMACDVHRRKLDPFFRHMGNTPLSEWTYADFEDYIASKTWKAATTRKYVVACRKLINWLGDRGIPCQNFIGNFKPPKVQRPTPKVATREEVVKLLDASYGHRLHTCIGLAALAGLRRCELDTLRWSDVDLAARMLMIRSPKTKTTDPVAVSDKLAEILAEWGLDEDRPEDQVIRFPSFGLTTGNGNRDLAKLCKRVGIRRLGWHSMRHFYCASMLNAGAPTGDVQRLMRHRSLQTTSLYSHPTKAGMSAAVELVL